MCCQRELEKKLVNKKNITIFGKFVNLGHTLLRTLSNKENNAYAYQIFIRPLSRNVTNNKETKGYALRF
uniref:Uncharacterized protein n=1 Tax=Rhizophora mucronata TaxID=61149 RepID=A0A2P2NQB9_RHIMU